MGVFDIVSQPAIKWLNQLGRARSLQLSDFERIKYELRPCDVLLVEGRTRVSNVIRVITQSPWTHAALYVGRINDIEDPDLQKIVQHHYKGDINDRLVIESLLGRGTVVNNLDTYRSEHLRICRPSRLGVKDAQQVIRYAISRLGVDYDVRQIFDLARFLFPWSLLPRRWRSTLFQQNPGKSTRTVCSTMIAEAFAFVQFPILPLVKHSEDEKVQLFRRNPRLCTPSDFDYSPYFKIIKYPFVDIDYRNDPQLLPWHTSGDLNKDEIDMYLQGALGPSPADVDQAIMQAVTLTETASEEIHATSHDTLHDTIHDTIHDSIHDSTGKSVPETANASPGETLSEPTDKTTSKSAKSTPGKNGPNDNQDKPQVH